ncbi:hypothetical protein WS96_00290 [Burkholderia sp. MSMB1835]|nr:hypothetical protein WS96_00290 [Burkholderia sp. MSMB1835]
MRINREAQSNRLERARVRPRAKRQHTSLPRTDDTSGNELKQSVTKRNDTVKSRFASQPIRVWTSKMKGLTTH